MRKVDYNIFAGCSTFKGKMGTTTCGMLEVGSWWVKNGVVCNIPRHLDDEVQFI
jgi:hypothetical protein